MPRTMGKKPAPYSRLKTIGCNCKDYCSKLGYDSRKGSYHCSSLRGQCQINGCTNEHNILEQNEDEVGGLNFGMNK